MSPNQNEVLKRETKDKTQISEFLNIEVLSLAEGTDPISHTDDTELDRII